ncbi:MAG: MATE family efflux transporter [Prevotella sp.]|nr:MATE family efflux transporter [Prevotella sp.]
MAKKEKTDLLSYIRDGRTLTQSQKLRLIVNLSIPSILAQISATVMFFIDYAMVGHLGEKATASVGLVESTTWLIGGLASAASLGFSVQVAHFIGANDLKAARRVLRQSLVCCFLWSLMLSLICVAVSPSLPFWLGGTADIAHDATMYFLIVGLAGMLFQMEGLAGSMLKCSGNMKIPSALNIMMCVLDVAFNYLFIYQLNLGVMGAAMGTAVAELITALMMLYFLLWRSDSLRLFNRHTEHSEHQAETARQGEKLENFRPTADVVSTAIKIGAPMGLQHLLMGSAQVVSTIIVAPLGTVAIAANSMAITVESLCYMPGYGIAEAATTLVGQSIGAGQRLLTRSFAYMSVVLGITVMTVMGVLMYVFAPELMAFMTPVEAIITEGAQALRIEAWAEPMFAATIVCNGIFIGAGDTLKPAIMSLSSMWGVRLTLAYYLAPRYGLRGVWTAMAIDLIFRGLVFLIRLFRGRWAKMKSAPGK